MPITIYETADLLYQERPNLRPVLNGGNARHFDVVNNQFRWVDRYGNAWVVTLMTEDPTDASAGPLVAIQADVADALGRCVVLAEDMTRPRVLSLVGDANDQAELSWVLDRLSVREVWPRFD